MHESTDSANRAYDWSYFLHRIDGSYFKIPNGRNWPNTNYLGSFHGSDDTRYFTDYAKFKTV